MCQTRCWTLQAYTSQPLVQCAAVGRTVLLLNCSVQRCQKHTSCEAVSACRRVPQHPICLQARLTRMEVPLQRWQAMFSTNAAALSSASSLSRLSRAFSSNCSSSVQGRAHQFVSVSSSCKKCPT